MKLTELEPQFIRYETKQQAVRVIIGDHETWRARGCPSEEIIKPVQWRLPVQTLAEAQGMFFLCPVCFTKNKGRIGTHCCEVTFAGRNVPDNEGTHNSSGRAVRWTVTGTDFSNLSTQPSILLEGGCGWHGFITNGEVS